MKVITRRRDDTPENHRHWIISKILQGNNQRILDIGFNQHPNKHLQGEVWGVDKEISSKPPNYKAVKKIDLDKEKLPFEKDFFDAVIICDVIEHVESPCNLLRDVRRVLKPEGMLIITLPNVHSITEVLAGMTSSNRYRDKTHIYSFTKNNLVNLLGRLGFEIISIKGYRMKIPYLNISFVSEKISPLLSTGRIVISTKK